MSRKKLCECLLFSAFVAALLLVPQLFKAEITPVARLYPVYVIVIGTLFAWGADRETIAPRMHEGSVYLLTLTFAYALTPWSFTHQIIAAAAVLPASTVAVSAFWTFSRGTKMRMTWALWAFFASAVLAAQQIFLGGASLITPADFEWSILLIAEHFMSRVLVCASLVHLITNILPMFIFFRDERESRAAYLRRLQKEEVPFVRDRILSTDIPLPVTLAITILHGLPLFLNWKFQIVSFELALAYALIISPILTFSLCDKLLVQTAHEKRKRDKNVA